MTEMNAEDTTVECFVVGPFQENTFFLRKAVSEELILIDPGDEAERLTALIDESGWKPVAIVNTHAHLDHMGAVQPLKEKYKIPFYLHVEDEFLLKRAPEQAQMFGLQPPEVPEIDHQLEDGQILELAGLRIEVRHTPGHSPGGICLVLGNRVFAGDALFAGSVGRSDLPGGDHNTLITSIKERLLSLPDETTVHSGHGPDTTIGRERETNPFLQDGGFFTG